MFLTTADRLELLISLCCNFTSHQVQFIILCCANAVHMLWLSLGPKLSWLGFRKDHALAYLGQEMSHGPS